MAMLMSPLALRAQLTLDSCRQKAHDNYPMIKQYALINRSRDYTIGNIGKAWLPQVNAMAGAAAYTDMLDIPAQARMLTGETKNWTAGAMISLQQQIYDGGQTTAQKNTARAETEVSRRNVDVSMYAVNDRIEQLFFGILLIDEQLKQNRLLQNDLGINERQVADMMKGGLANATDIDAVKVEEVKCRQSEASLTVTRQAYLRMLGYFIGEQLNETTTLVAPNETATTKIDAITRPELQWYAARQSLLGKQRKQLDTQLMPTVKAFGAAIAHTSLADMMHNTFAAAGVTVSWNIGALYTRKNDLYKLQVEADRIDAEQQTFLFNNHLQTEETQGQITALKKQLDLDRETVRLREDIYSKSMKKVKLGTETVNEMLRDAIAVSQARQQQSLHNIQLQQAINHQNTLQGR
jgi:outer membrane protein TolC